MTVTENVKRIPVQIFAMLALLLTAQPLWAQLQIEIVDGNPSALPIAIVPFEWQDPSPPPINGVDQIVSGDLYRSGLFDPMAVEDMAERPVDPEAIRFGTWRLLKVDYIVVGKVRKPAAGEGHEIVYQLFDVHTQEELLSRITTVGPGDLRSAPTASRTRSTRP
jgi:TolB protein